MLKTKELENFNKDVEIKKVKDDYIIYVDHNYYCNCPGIGSALRLTREVFGESYGRSY